MAPPTFLCVCVCMSANYNFYFSPLKIFREARKKNLLSFNWLRNFVSHTPIELFNFQAAARKSWGANKKKVKNLEKSLSVVVYYNKRENQKETGRTNSTAKGELIKINFHSHERKWKVVSRWNDDERQQRSLIWAHWANEI